MPLHNNVNYKLAITQDKLIDLLMGAATREDIAKLDHKVDKVDCRVDELRVELRADIVRLDGKIDDLRTEVRADISRLDLKFEDKFETMEQKLNGTITTSTMRIEKRLDHLDAAFGKLDMRYDKLDLQYKQLILFMVASILVPIFLHFMK